MYTDKLGARITESYRRVMREIRLMERSQEDPLLRRREYSSSGHLAFGQKLYAGNNVREEENTAGGYSGDVRDLYNRTISRVTTWNESRENLVTNLLSALLFSTRSWI